jgi:hypothetical protein
MLRIVIDLDQETADLENLYLAKSVLKLIDQGYQEDGVETPESIMDKLSAVSGEIVNRNRAELQKKLKMAKARRSSLATPDEKRSRLDVEIAKLEAQLK